MSTRAQLVTLLNDNVKSGNSDTTAAGVRTFENDFIVSAVNKTDDLNINNGYLGISSGRVDITFINAAVQTGKFLRDDGTWQTVSTGASSLSTTLSVGNITGGYSILISAGDQIDSQLAAGTLNLGTTLAGTVNIGSAATNINLVGSYIGQTSITTLGTITTGTLGSGAKILVGSDATGDIYYNGGSGAITRLGVGASAGMFLRSTGSLPGWSTLILPNAATSGRIVYASATNTYGETSALTWSSSNGIVVSQASSDYGFSYTRTSGGETWRLNIDGSDFLRLSNSATGNVDVFFRKGFPGIGVGIGATASVHIQSETSTAATQPIKFVSPSNNATAVSQTFGPLVGGDSLYFVIATGSARKNIVMDDGTLLTSGKIPVASTNGRLIDSTAATLITAGVAAIIASTFEKPETGNDANVLTYTTGGGADEFLNVQIATDVSSITGIGNLTVTVSWKDSNNNSATSSQVLTGVGDGSVNIAINSKAGNTVVVSTVFTGTTVAYNISAFITRLK